MTPDGRKDLYTKSISPFLRGATMAGGAPSGPKEHLLPLAKLKQLGAVRSVQVRGVKGWRMLWVGAAQPSPALRLSERGAERRKGRWRGAYLLLRRRGDLQGNVRGGPWLGVGRWVYAGSVAECPGAALPSHPHRPVRRCPAWRCSQPPATRSTSPSRAASTSQVRTRVSCTMYFQHAVGINPSAWTRCDSTTHPYQAGMGTAGQPFAFS